MQISGWEDWTPGEIAGHLSGEDIPLGDVEGLHGAVIVLARRVEEQRGEIENLRAAIRSEGGDLQTIASAVDEVVNAFEEVEGTVLSLGGGPYRRLSPLLRRLAGEWRRRGLAP